MVDLAIAVLFALVIALVLRAGKRIKDYRNEDEAPPMSDPLPPLPVEEEGNG